MDDLPDSERTEERRREDRPAEMTDQVEGRRPTARRRSPEARSKPETRGFDSAAGTENDSAPFRTPEHISGTQSDFYSYLIFKGLFGGPDRDRTDDLFHAMEARSQLRHRPTRKGRTLLFSDMGYDSSNLTESSIRSAYRKFSRLQTA